MAMDSKKSADAQLSSIVAVEHGGWLTSMDRSTLVERIKSEPGGKRMVGEAMVRGGEIGVRTALTAQVIYNAEHMATAGVNAEIAFAKSAIASLASKDLPPRMREALAEHTQEISDDLHDNLRTIIITSVRRQVDVINRPLGTERPPSLLDLFRE